ncbi:hypothetical protein SDJN02_00025 [Cucurbita argyrosperma subsp. argyrosperma]
MFSISRTPSNFESSEIARNSQNQFSPAAAAHFLVHEKAWCISHPLKRDEFACSALPLLVFLTGNFVGSLR